ncbi:Phage protein [Mycoavidus cysteinexigens]|uniref:Phage protein n=1 Tax=Mycoavidus cysteinexigens TaxID=1553431 RepID=A0A2Z6EVU0_9BURK|nr:siphovirus Gp157 family protein [Mycoavidus cysteinexigens]BBE09580.1 Phage protein [Mycoavidus cysteinexigens]GAM51659.1 hypothetical protein EBME_0122 [bacterium endosymbiont of Mortierella elongata FMR23-6]GLR01038.1 hypothetical protein GCM10007934_08500 [Mycoavidus cysteinexigens]
MKTSLYILAAEYREAADKLTDLDLDEQTLSDTLESIAGGLDTKAENLAKLIRELKSHEERASTEAKRIQERAQRFTSRREWLSEYLKDSLIHAGRLKIEMPYFTVSVRKNPAAVVIDDEKALPRDYWVTPTPESRPDKKRIAQALKEGLSVPGARSVSGQSLQIK